MTNPLAIHAANAYGGASPFKDGPSLRDDQKTWKRLELNHRRNLEQDHTEKMDAASAAFAFASCRDEMWNPERYSLLWGTPIWDQASSAQRVALNHLYWIAYYSQIISAEIATIFYNQTSAAGLYAEEDFRLVCDTLDLESTQERAHINAFRRVSDAVEKELFAERIFSYAMRGPYDETMVHADSSAARRFWKKLQLRAWGLLSSGSAFIACQYFTIRGLRTLNGKLVQHHLSRTWAGYQDKEQAPIPSAISHYHFQDESYHFNTSMMVAQDVVRSLRTPTRFEKAVVNTAIQGCQRDHFHFSTAITGIFWYDPSLYAPIYKVLTSPCFGMDRGQALQLMERSFCRENDGMRESERTHATARESYVKFLDRMDFISGENREMALMQKSTLDRHLRDNQRAFARFAREAHRVIPGDLVSRWRGDRSVGEVV
jgi:hypothetical protein